MTSKAFFDTNVLIYSIDSASPAKKREARSIIGQHKAAGTAVVSTQVLQEFFVVTTHKLGVDPHRAKSFVMDHSELETVTISPAIVLEAIDLAILIQLSLWDALILAAASTAKCSVLYSEDMQDGFSLRGVTVRNPFAGLDASSTT